MHILLLAVLILNQVCTGKIIYEKTNVQIHQITTAKLFQFALGTVHSKVHGSRNWNKKW